MPNNTTLAAALAGRIEEAEQAGRRPDRALAILKLL
jgi:hypothetical protein